MKLMIKAALLGLISCSVVVVTAQEAGPIPDYTLDCQGLDKGRCKAIPTKCGWKKRAKECYPLSRGPRPTAAPTNYQSWYDQYEATIRTCRVLTSKQCRSHGSCKYGKKTGCLPKMSPPVSQAPTPPTMSPTTAPTTSKGHYLAEVEFCKDLGFRKPCRSEKSRCKWTGRRCVTKMEYPTTDAPTPAPVPVPTSAPIGKDVWLQDQARCGAVKKAGAKFCSQASCSFEKQEKICVSSLPKPESITEAPTPSPTNEYQKYVGEHEYCFTFDKPKECNNQRQGKAKRCRWVSFGSAGGKRRGLDEEQLGDIQSDQRDLSWTVPEDRACYSTLKKPEGVLLDFDQWNVISGQCGASTNRDECASAHWSCFWRGDNCYTYLLQAASFSPTMSPSSSPTKNPSVSPSVSPSMNPTMNPSPAPIDNGGDNGVGN